MGTENNNKASPGLEGAVACRSEAFQEAMEEGIARREARDALVAPASKGESHVPGIKAPFVS